MEAEPGVVVDGEDEVVIFCERTIEVKRKRLRRLVRSVCPHLLDGDMVIVDELELEE